MDVRSFMPVSETIKTNPKKIKTKRNIIIDDNNSCKIIEKNKNVNGFDVSLDALVKESKPNIKSNKRKGKNSKKEQLKDEKLTRSAQDIYDKYKRKGAGTSDNVIDSAHWIKKNLFDNCRIKANVLYRIMKYYQVIKHDVIALENLAFSNIIEKPFNFLNAKYQFLSFKKCEFIMDVYKLHSSIEKATIANGYIFDKFLWENTYYLPQYKFIHQSQTKKLSEVKNLIETNSPMFPYKYDVLEHDFYETLGKHGINSKNDALRFGKNKDLALQTVSNSKRNTFWTTEKFLELEHSYGALLKEHFGNEQKTECPYKKNAIKEWIKETEIVINMNSENTRKIVLNEQQIKAVNTALRYKLMCISGYPGTGKSTIVDFIVRFRREVMRLPTCLMAPTGKAVKSLMSKLENGQSAKGQTPLIATCHKFVYNIFAEYRKYKENPNAEIKDSIIKSYVEADKNPFETIIIDEASMIDFNIFMEIIDFAVEYGNNIIFVGDIHQLPPVSAGRPYECIYKSGLFKCVELNQIMRSSGNISKFVLSLNANRFSELPNYFDGKEIKRYDTSNFSESYFKAFFKQIIEKEPNGLTGFKRNYSVISAQNGNEDGQGRDWEGSVNLLNQVLQELCLEIKKKEIEESGEYEEILSVHTNKRSYYDSDRVIRTVNDYGSSDGKIRVNGEMGSLQIRKKVDQHGMEKTVIDVLYDDGDVETNLDVLDLEDNFNLAYASTVHKMQGSENKNIVVVMSNQHYMWKGEGCKKLLYTAISRAKEQLLIISCMGAFSESVNKYCGKPENSFHSEFLIKM